MSLILAIIAQIGPFGSAPAIPRPAIEGRDRLPPRPAAVAKPPPALPALSHLQLCLAEAGRAPQQAVASANGWLANVTGAARAQPLRCRGVAQSNLELWGAAEQSFIAARDAAPASEHALRASLGGMAGDAALAGGSAERALGLFDLAHGEAQAVGEIRLTGEIALDSARALVALKRDAEADKALVEARTSSADNPLAWLLSATLSRRQGKLMAAQAQIVAAAGLAPTDPEIGLEAGVIAMMDGRQDAARKSWQSVIALAPQSDAGAAARGYLAQLDAKPQSKP